MSVKPSETPSMWGKVRRKPKFMPDVINIRLFGPGVIEDTKAKMESAANISIVIMRALYGKLHQMCLRYCAILPKVCNK
jgi:hypothetical protein